VEISELVTQTLSGLPDAVLEKSRFGRSESVLFWLDPAQLLAAAQALKAEVELDWLENLSAMQVEEDIVFTYFLQKPETTQTVILRVSVPMPSFGDEAIEVQSLTTVWPMAAPFEDEIAKLFGVKFDGREPTRSWDGFPLRKNFVLNGGVAL
jgi:NADH:ubiquinone oxidoreductase subunit C